jgi:hypothetical protein
VVTIISVADSGEPAGYLAAEYAHKCIFAFADLQQARLPGRNSGRGADGVARIV